MNFNRFFIAGKVINEPRFGFTRTGKFYFSFSLEVPTAFGCKPFRLFVDAYERQAKNMKEKGIRFGTNVFIEGRLIIESYKDTKQGGAWRTVTKCKLISYHVLGDMLAPEEGLHEDDGDNTKYDPDNTPEATDESVMEQNTEPGDDPFGEVALPESDDDIPF